MAQTIRYMSRAQGVTPAADHAASTAQPKQGSVPALNQQITGVPIFEKSTITMAAATDPLATNDIYVAACLPAFHELIDGYIVCEDLDTGASLTITLAQLYQDFTNIVASTDLVTASTIGQAGGIARASVAAGLLIDATTYDRWYGIKIAAGAAGLNAGAKLRVVLIYIPSDKYVG